MTAEDSKRLEVREIIRDTLAHHGHEGDELLEALMYELEASSMSVRADAMDRRLAQDREARS